MVALILAEVGGVAAGGSIEAGIQGMRAMAQSVTMVRPAKTEKRAEATKAFKLSAKIGAIAAGLGVAANAMYDSGDSESGDEQSGDSEYSVPPGDVDEGWEEQTEENNCNQYIVQGYEPFLDALREHSQNTYNYDLIATKVSKRR
jgi:hypothetical protein